MNNTEKMINDAKVDKKEMARIERGKVFILEIFSFIFVMFSMLFVVLAVLK